MSLEKPKEDNESAPKDDREYSSAVFLCPRCNHVFALRPFKNQTGKGKCPRCGHATDNFVTRD